MNSFQIRTFNLSFCFHPTQRRTTGAWASILRAAWALYRLRADKMCTGFSLWQFASRSTTNDSRPRHLRGVPPQTG